MQFCTLDLLFQRVFILKSDKKNMGREEDDLPDPNIWVR